MIQPEQATAKPTHSNQKFGSEKEVGGRPKKKAHRSAPFPVRLDRYCTAVDTTTELLVMLKPATDVVSVISERTMPTPDATQTSVLVFELEPTAG